MVACLRCGEDNPHLVRGFFERAASQRSCHLVTILGEAGVGKTRLVEELERRIEQRAAVRRGWCRPYGEGITFEPIAEIIRRMADMQEGSSLTESENRLAALIARSEQAESRAQAFADLAEVLQVAGRAGEASAPLERALELYEAKGNLVMAERTRALLMSTAAQ